MISFFRTHQKIFFIIITAIIIITFSFFGTHSAIEGTAKRHVKDKVVSKTVSGKEIMLSDLESLSYFLLREEEISARLNLQSSVLQKDFLENKVIIPLVKNYLDKFALDFQQKMEKIKKFTPYVHPQVDFISAKTAWKQFAPEIKGKLEELQKKDKFDIEAFSIFSDLYLAQNKFAPETLKRILLYQQAQYQWITPDVSLLNEDMNLFGFKTAIDWFGQDFIDLISQVILHVSSLAQQKGYKISDEEALADLIKHSKENFSQTKIPDNALFKYSLDMYGMREKMIVSIWKNILLFRCYMNDCGEGVFVDNLCADEMTAFTKQKAQIDLYKFPKELQIKSFDEFIKLLTYLQAVCPRTTGINLPTKYLPVETIEKNYPQLVEKRFEVKVKHLNLNNISLSIGEKKLWGWQTEDENFCLLAKEFPEIKNGFLEKEKRFSYLESLGPKSRQKIDNFSRKKILLKDPQFIRNELSKAPEVKKSIGIKGVGGKSPFQGVDVLRLASFLDKEKIQSEDISVKQDSPLFCYSDNDEDFYQITLLSQTEGKSIVSFADALQEEILDQLLDKKLEAKYAKLSDKEAFPFKNKEGVKKNLSEVKNQVALLAFKDILNKIDEKRKTANLSHLNSLDAYPVCYLYFNLLSLKEKLATNSQEDLLGLWQADKQKISVTIQSEDEWTKDVAFSNEPFAWSAVHIDKDNQVFFFQIIEKATDEKATLEDLCKTKKVLSDEAKRVFMEDFIGRLEKDNLIKITVGRTIE